MKPKINLRKLFNLLHEGLSNIAVLITIVPILLRPYFKNTTIIMLSECLVIVGLACYAIPMIEKLSARYKLSHRKIILGLAYLFFAYLFICTLQGTFFPWKQFLKYYPARYTV